MAFSPQGTFNFVFRISVNSRAMATKPRDRNGLGAPRQIDLRRRGQPGRVDRQRFEALPQHLPPLAERRRRDLLQRPAIARLGACAGHQPHHRRGDLGLRHEGGGRNVEQDFRLGAPVREHAEPPIGLVILARDDALGHLALKHQHHHVVPGRPRLDRQPVDQQRGRDVVGQVGDDFRLGGRRAAAADRNAARRRRRSPAVPDIALKSPRAPAVRARRARRR